MGQLSALSQSDGEKSNSRSISLREMLAEVHGAVGTTLAGTELGRILQLIRAADVQIGVFFPCSCYISRARSMARMTACALLIDSWCSSSGTESATMPAPACT